MKTAFLAGTVSTFLFLIIILLFGVKDNVSVQTMVFASAIYIVMNMFLIKYLERC